MKRLAALVVCAAIALSACGKSTAAPTTVFVAGVSDVDAMAVDSTTGDFFYGVGMSGDVFELTGGAGQSHQVAHVDVSTAGQRGLLGLAVDKNHRVFAGYTAANGAQNVTVAQVLPGPARVVWNGPASASLANGGRLAFAPNGRLTIGIGDLTDRSQLASPTTPNGKMLSLDPDGASTQTPTVISSNWNNPFAFAYSSTGALWIGDNEPGDASERLARGDLANGATHITHIGAHKVASGIAFTSADTLYECTYLGHSLQKYKIDSSGTPKKSGGPLTSDCSLGVISNGDGTLVYSTGSALKAVAAR